MSNKSTGTPTSTAAQDFEDQVAASAMHEIRRWIQLAAKPATDEQLTLIWPPWNVLPADLLPEEKSWILTLDVTSKYCSDKTWIAHFEALRRQFNYLPLCPHEYHQALFRARRWSDLLISAETTARLHQRLIERQSAFSDADSQAAGRVAISRAAQEIRLTHPKLLESSTPTLQAIEVLESRYENYLRERERALFALSELVFKVPGMRTGEVLPLKERAFGVPHPPADVPEYLYIARLDALGVCSPERLKKFLRYKLWRLARRKRQQFDRMRRKPHFGKEPYAGFLVWVLDNRPVFEHPDFGWQWKDIVKAAEDRGIECPKTCLKQWAYRSRVRLKVKLGQPNADAAGITLSERLLSPAPVFGDVLKFDSR